jgi:O-antigen ligase
MLLVVMITLVTFAKFLPPIVATGFVIFVLAFFVIKQEIGHFLILFFLLLFLSDSRQEIFLFAKDAKTISALLLPVSVLGIWRKLKYNSHFLMHIALFLIIAWITLFWADNPSLAFQKTLSYTLIIICIPALFIYCFQEDKSFLKDIFYLFSILLLIGLAMKYVMADMVIMEKNARFTGLLGNPNGIGIFITLSFLYFQILYRTKLISFNRKDLIFFYIGLFASLFFCKSRTAMMTVIIFYSLNIIYNYSHFIGWIFFFTLAYMYEFILEAIPLVTDVLGFSEDLRVENVDKIKRGSGRDIAWAFAWKNIEPQIFWGHGISATEELYITNYKSLSMLGHEGNAHNSYLTIWYDTGLVGLVSFFIGIITYFIKVSKKMPFVMPVLFAIFFSINYESWLSASLNPFTTMFLMLVSLLGYLALDVVTEEDRIEVEEEGVKTELA